MPQSISQATQPMHPSKKTTASEMSREATLSGSAEAINASGHKQELQRNFSLLNICGVGITTGNTWTAIGGSIVSLFSFLLSPSIASLGCRPYLSSVSSLPPPCCIVLLHWLGTRHKYLHPEENFNRTNFGCRLGRGYLQWRPRRCTL